METTGGLVAFFAVVTMVWGIVSYIWGWADGRKKLMAEHNRRVLDKRRRELRKQGTPDTGYKKKASWETEARR